MASGRSIDPGFGYEPTGILQINASVSRYTTEEGRLFYEELIERIGSLDGVRGVGLADGTGIDGELQPASSDPSAHSFFPLHLKDSSRHSPDRQKIWPSSQS